jgi:uncharacterized protein YecT (DUF1311 family)
MRPILAAVLLIAGPAAAQDAAEALPAVRACLAGDAAQACIGAFAKECMAASPQGETTVGMTACTLAEADAWDQVLNELFGELVAGARGFADRDAQAGVPAPDLEALLRTAQRAWMAFRDADCAEEVAVWGEGTMRQVAGANCTLARTAQRVIELRDKRAALEN